MNGNDLKYDLLQNENPLPGQQTFNQPGAPPAYSGSNQPIAQPEIYAVSQQPYPGQPSGNTGYYPSDVPRNHLVSQTTVHAQPVTIQPHQTYNIVNTTTVVTTQPGRKWRSGLCDCCSDCRSCMCAWCCRSCYNCGTAKRMGESGWAGLLLIGTTAMRTKFRLVHNIEGSICDDVCVAMWCEPCMMCQLGREMDAEQYPKSCCGTC